MVQIGKPSKMKKEFCKECLAARLAARRDYMVGWMTAAIFSYKLQLGSKSAPIQAAEVPNVTWEMA
jgi:hypothetical protein